MKHTKIITLCLMLSFVLFCPACTAQPAQTQPESTPPATPAATPAETPETEPTTPAPEENPYVNPVTGLPSPFTYDSLAGLKGEEWANAAIKKNAAAAEKYAATRYTTPSGVTVQKVPNDGRAYNVAVLNAEMRGCNSCHDLSAALEMLPMSHPQLENPYDSAELSVEMCMTCHHQISFAGVKLGDSMHALHMNSDCFTEDMNGNCLSCHNIDITTGEFALWDRVKYNVLQGITAVPADNAKVETHYVQDVITPYEDIYGYWENADKTGIPTLFSTDPEVLANWVITVTGAVPEPAEINMKEFFGKYKDREVTEVRKMHCTVDGISANQIAQVEVTGIPLNLLLEEAGFDTAQTCLLTTIGIDGMKITTSPYEDTLLVYKINGQELSAFLGHPFQIWQSDCAASQFIKAPVSIDIALTDTPKAKGVGLNIINCGIFNYRDGQVFQMGEEIVFEGHADSYRNQITSVEFSFDMGNTWIPMSTVDSDPSAYVHWYCKFTPESIGSYVFQVRATNELGDVVEIPVWSLFHVE